MPTGHFIRRALLGGTRHPPAQGQVGPTGTMSAFPKAQHSGCGCEHRLDEAFKGMWWRRVFQILPLSRYQTIRISFP